MRIGIKMSSSEAGQSRDTLIENNLFAEGETCSDLDAPIDVQGHGVHAGVDKASDDTKPREHTTIKLLVLNYDPYVGGSGKRLHEHKGWFDPSWVGRVTCRH